MRALNGIFFVYYYTYSIHTHDLYNIIFLHILTLLLLTKYL